MCGIVGIVNFDSAPVERQLLERMTALIAHRGPDDAGHHCEGSVGLGHRRLSIIDLSSAGHQPMASEDRALWIVYNGECYNYAELASRLKATSPFLRASCSFLAVGSSVFSDIVRAPRIQPD